MKVDPKRKKIKKIKKERALERDCGQKLGVSALGAFSIIVLVFKFLSLPTSNDCAVSTFLLGRNFGSRASSVAHEAICTSVD